MAYSFKNIQNSLYDGFDIKAAISEPSFTEPDKYRQYLKEALFEIYSTGDAIVNITDYNSNTLPGLPFLLEFNLISVSYNGTIHGTLTGHLLYKSYLNEMKTKEEFGYLTLLNTILTEGKYRKPINEEGRYEVFGKQLSFDLTNNKIPLFSSKKVFFKSLAAEMLWFLKGDQDISYLKENNVKIWDIWANEEGIVGPMYGFMMRHWPIDPSLQDEYFNGAKEIDQIAAVVESLRNKPEARSHMVTMWRPDLIPLQSIKACHVLLQFYKVDDELSLTMFQRSVDSAAGLPFNIAQYSLLCHMVAHQLGCKAKEFIWVGGDTHIYENHIEQVKKQLETPLKDFPTIKFNRLPKDIFSYELQDFTIENYVHGEYLPLDISPQGTPGTGKEFVFRKFYFLNHKKSLFMVNYSDEEGDYERIISRNGKTATEFKEGNVIGIRPILDPIKDNDPHLKIRIRESKKDITEDEVDLDRYRIREANESTESILQNIVEIDSGVHEPGIQAIRNVEKKFEENLNHENDLSNSGKNLLNIIKKVLFNF